MSKPCHAVPTFCCAPPHRQVTLELPDGRSVAVPVSENTTGAALQAYAASLLGQPASNVHLCHPGSGSPAGGQAAQPEEPVAATHGMRLRSRVLPPPDMGERYHWGGWSLARVVSFRMVSC